MQKGDEKVLQVEIEKVDGIGYLITKIEDGNRGRGYFFESLEGKTHYLKSLGLYASRAKKVIEIICL